MLLLWLSLCCLWMGSKCATPDRLIQSPVEQTIEQSSSAFIVQALDHMQALVRQWSRQWNLQLSTRHFDP
eukprot:4354740-Alexandrium_andersonii.AAC.1